jgi:hypothetical protein
LQMVGSTGSSASIRAAVGRHAAAGGAGAPWPTSRPCSSWTSPSRRWMPSPAATSRSCSCACGGRAARSSSSPTAWTGGVPVLRVVVFSPRPALRAGGRIDLPQPRRWATLGSNPRMAALRDDARAGPVRRARGRGPTMGG